MKSLIKTWNGIQIPYKYIPIFLLSICLLTYGIQSSSLGFYQDDWNVVYHMASGGLDSVFELYNYDGHPTGAWSRVFSFNLLGYSPFFWQIYSIFWRFLATLGFWLTIDCIWPKKNILTVSSALIFATYPLFYLQAQAVTYFEVWMSFTFLWFSIFFNLKALHQKDKMWQFMFIAIVLKISHIFTTEYTWGVELIRPVLIWYGLTNLNQKGSLRIRNLFIFSWPYLLIFVITIVWRGFFYVSPVIVRSEPVFLNQFAQNPIDTILFFISNSLPDIILLLVSGWYKIIQPKMFNLTERFNFLVFLLIVFSSLLIWIFIKKLKIDHQNNNRSYEYQTLFTGVAAMIFGLIPAYAAGYFISIKIEPWNGRFALGSIPGIALIIISIFKMIISERKYQYAIFALLIGLSIGWQVRMSNQFRWAWDRQVNFYRQLILRAPELDPGTSIISENEFLMYMGGYPTAFAVNTLYVSEGKPYVGSNDPNYWFFPLSDFYNSLSERLEGVPFSEKRAAVNFQGEPEGSIFISNELKGVSQCLWVMRPEYERLKVLSQTGRRLASISNIGRIKQSPENSDLFLYKYLYTKTEKDWCYYYQKADLANQFKQWDEVVNLWETALQNELEPDNGFEYLPFIEALAHKGDWKTAETLTKTSQKTLKGIDPLLCYTWNKLEDDTPDSIIKEEALKSIREDIKCE